MNIQSPPWASYFPNSPSPLSSGLSSVFKPDLKLPPDLQRLLERLSAAHRRAPDAANNNDGPLPVERAR